MKTIKLTSSDAQIEKIPEHSISELTPVWESKLSCLKEELQGAREMAVLDGCTVPESQIFRRKPGYTQFDPMRAAYYNQD